MNRSRKCRLFATLLAVITLHGAPSFAKFSVCNQSIDVINVAVGRERSETFETEGWWTIGANQCADVIRTDLTSRYIYVYVMDVFGQALLNGTTEMCVGRRSFEIQGTQDCWERGYRTEQFFEVDTGNVATWTLFVAAPAQ